MIQTDELRGIIAKRRMSQAEVASVIGISPKTFYNKMKKGVFGSDEIETMITYLKIDNAMDIFFAQK
ncbi:MAG TPA: DUF739 domain-containing protein [Lactococcus sp.]|nr:DUF739 domain-containing protein [Lactococcus sp.]